MGTEVQLSLSSTAAAFLHFLFILLIMMTDISNITSFVEQYYLINTVSYLTMWNANTNLNEVIGLRPGGWWEMFGVSYSHDLKHHSFRHFSGTIPVCFLFYT